MSNLASRMAYKPTQTLRKLAEKSSLDIVSREFADYMDSKDPLRKMRDEFFYPRVKDLPGVDLSLVDGDQDSIYFCGNSLGLQPRGCRELIDRSLTKWEQMGVLGHTSGWCPWKPIEDILIKPMAEIIGAKDIEVVAMNTLTVNLHMMMVPFYRPTPQRYKILMEGKAFPSDQYAAQSQVHFHGFDPDKDIIEVFPREGEQSLRTEDILSAIEEHGNSIALVLFSGVQYYTGQFFDMKTITAAAQKKGCVVGWDLAHAVGNVELHLHDWNVDFACWCTYKYLNSGPGGIAGAFVHEKHAYNFELPKFAGWWGTDRNSRFQMRKEFEQIPGAHGYQCSNPPVFQCLLLRASLDVFEKTSVKEIRAKGDLLTAYLELLLLHYFSPSNDITKNGKTPHVSIITPTDPKDRGCQLSVKFSVPVDKVFEELCKRGFVGDIRHPDVMRIAPAPLYNSFADVHRFISMLNAAFKTITPNS
ncbi:kynureninase isoform X2 [Nematostella vectensis]|uniref:kynureninase isoform X2 n=1 Tax=Nematostella vectensis TaxID=45351 RepID=UPI0020770554|nr:kynureninase isoform X2 [Nematostella vectensis]